VSIDFGEPVQTRWPWFNWPSWARRILTLSFLALVNWLMLAPAGVFRGIHVFLAHQDKIAHFGIFLTLAFLVRWSLNRERIVQAAVFVALVIYAGSIEVFQPLLTKMSRGFEWLDLVSNYVGIFTGWYLFGKTVFDPKIISLHDMIQEERSVQGIAPGVVD